MGRWGDGLYESDSALDFFSTITDRLEREAAYLFTAENIAHWFMPEDDSLAPTWWLAKVMAVIEPIVLFISRDIGSSVFLQPANLLSTWRKQFFTIWDGDWKEGDNRYAFSEPEYRQANRSLVLKQFDYLENLSRFWVKLTTGEKLEPPQPFDDKLPYFSLRRWADKTGNEHVSIERFTGDLMGYLEREIIYLLSAEKRNEASAFFAVTEEIVTSVDVLGFLCAAYEQSPGVRETVVENWRQATVQLWKDFVSSDNHEWDENDGHYRNAMAAFDRLAAVARQYPAQEW